MSFLELYPVYNKLKIGCNVMFKIVHITVGAGGSDNIIMIVQDGNIHLVIKIIPSIVAFKQECASDKNQLEIKFYQFFTKKYLLTKRTPHIVGIYNHQICDNFSKLIKSIEPKKCPTYEDQLFDRFPITNAEAMVCKLLDGYDMKLVNPQFDMLLLEFCDPPMADYISYAMEEIHKNKGEKLEEALDAFIYTLNTILFQLIFTLAIIKDDYPGFMHGDFFVRNILLQFRRDDNNTDYIAYHYKQRIYYLRANGCYAKINDFGDAVIVNELESSLYQDEKKFHKWKHYNPFNKKTDIFNLLHDIYDGQNLGSFSIRALQNKLQIDPKKLTSVIKFMSVFIDIDVIDKINSKNYDLLSGTWNIDGIKILEDSVLTPDEYLTNKTFANLQKLPEGATIVRHYNEPK